MNGGPVEMRNTTRLGSIDVAEPGVSFKHGGIGSHLANCAVQHRGGRDRDSRSTGAFAGIGQLQLNVSVSNDEACEPTRRAPGSPRWINVDDIPNVSNVDTVRARRRRGRRPARTPIEIWDRASKCHAVQPRVVRPRLRRGCPTPRSSRRDLHVGTAAPLVIAFDHAFGFETDGGVRRSSTAA